MDLSDLLNATKSQEAGHEFDILDPVEGRPTGLKITVAGPDSEIMRKARADMEEEVNRATSSRGTLSPKARERLMTDFLFAVTLGWQVTEGGKSLPFNRENFDRLLSAGSWLRAQIDLFAGDRSPYYGHAKAGSSKKGAD